MARDPYKYFRVEARELADQLGQGLLELERSGSGGEIVSRLLRLTHTLKGAARIVRQPEIADHAHAIEEALSPFRELAGIVPRENVDAILRLIDGITGRVAALPAAEGGGAAPAGKAAPLPEETSRVVRTDVAEIDDLLDGVTEAYAQVSSLREVAGLAEKARRISDHISEQLAAAATQKSDHPEFGRVDRFVTSAELLRGLAGQLERSIAATHDRIDRGLRQVRDAAEQLRLVPAGALFQNFERAARDSAQALGKEVIFEGNGGDIRLDAHVVRIVQDAVLQMIRNAVAHGIEARRDRIAANKPVQGRVVVTVVRRGRQIVFRCEDDGRGIDVVALREAAIRKGRSAADLDVLDANGLVRVLLQGGISTSAVVTEVAGRGIGMDIVRAAVAKLAADFLVTTEPDKGTSFELIVPLSMSSVEALVVEGAGVTATTRSGRQDGLHDWRRLLPRCSRVPRARPPPANRKAVPPSSASRNSAKSIAASRYPPLNRLKENGVAREDGTEFPGEISLSPRRTAEGLGRSPIDRGIGESPSWEMFMGGFFFESGIVSCEKPPERGAAACDPPLAHRGKNLIQRQIRSRQRSQARQNCRAKACSNMRGRLPPPSN